MNIEHSAIEKAPPTSAAASDSSVLSKPIDLFIVEHCIHLLRKLHKGLFSQRSEEPQAARKKHMQQKAQTLSPTSPCRGLRFIILGWVWPSFH